MVQRKLIAWIDDKVDQYKGLRAFLEEVPSLTLRTGKTFADGVALIANEKIDVLLFDMILMSDVSRVSLDSQRGIDLAVRALEQGVRNFVAYSVVEEDELKKEWQKAIGERVWPSPEVVCRCTCKGRVSVVEVVRHVRDLLEIPQ